jgi:hypothetical protein
MARAAPRPQADRERVLKTLHRRCLGCGGRRRHRHDTRPAVTTLDGLVRLRPQLRRGESPGGARHRQPDRPEAEAAIVPPRHELGLDVIAPLGALRHREHRSVPGSHRSLRERGLASAGRTVTHLLDRYDEPLATALADDRRRRAALARQGRVLLALGGWQPDVGHAVWWLLRDCPSGEGLLARSPRSATGADLAGLLREVAAGGGVPIEGVVGDGQRSGRPAIQPTRPGVPHRRCRFRYLREAAHPVFEADRHAQQELKKRGRGGRPIERAVEGRAAAEAGRGAITDEGRAPLAASGLQLKARRDRVAAEGG